MPSEAQNREALARAQQRGAKINGHPDPNSATIIRKCQREVMAEAEAEAAQALADVKPAIVDGEAALARAEAAEARADAAEARADAAEARADAAEARLSDVLAATEEDDGDVAEGDDGDGEVFDA